MYDQFCYIWKHNKKITYNMYDQFYYIQKQNLLPNIKYKLVAYFRYDLVTYGNKFDINNLITKNNKDNLENQV